jgi:hypothetical protein
MKPLVTRADLVAVLLSWQSGAITAQQVHDWAESLYPGNCAYDDWDENGDSVALEVLGDLDKLNLDLVVPKDVPIYLAFLQTPPDQYSDGHRKYREAIGRINRAARRRALRNDPFYSRFCQ